MVQKGAKNRRNVLVAHGNERACEVLTSALFGSTVSHANLRQPKVFQVIFQGRCKMVKQDHIVNAFVRGGSRAPAG